MTRFAHLVSHVGGQRLGLTVGGPACQDHSFKQGGKMLCVVHSDLDRFDVLQGVDDDALKFLNVFFFCCFCHDMFE